MLNAERIHFFPQKAVCSNRDAKRLEITWVYAWKSRKRSTRVLAFLCTFELRAEQSRYSMLPNANSKCAVYINTNRIWTKRRWVWMQELTYCTGISIHNSNMFLINWYSTWFSSLFLMMKLLAVDDSRSLSFSTTEFSLEFSLTDPSWLFDLFILWALVDLRRDELMGDSSPFKSLDEEKSYDLAFNCSKSAFSFSISTMYLVKHRISNKAFVVWRTISGLGKREKATSWNINWKKILFWNSLFAHLLGFGTSSTKHAYQRTVIATFQVVLVKLLTKQCHTFVQKFRVRPFLFTNENKDLSF